MKKATMFLLVVAILVATCTPALANVAEPEEAENLLAGEYTIVLEKDDGHVFIHINYVDGKKNTVVFYGTTVDGAYYESFMLPNATSIYEVEDGVIIEWGEGDVESPKSPCTILGARISGILPD